MSHKVGVADAKARFSELLRRVADGETVVVERRGAPVAVLRPYRPGDDEANRSWVDQLNGVAEGLPEFSEIMDDVVTSRAKSKSRDVDFDA